MAANRQTDGAHEVNSGLASAEPRPDALSMTNSRRSLVNRPKPREATVRTTRSGAFALQKRIIEEVSNPTSRFGEDGFTYLRGSAHRS